MIRVAALTSGRWAPASRFRIRQHITPLREFGISVHEYLPFIDQVLPVPPVLRTVRRRHLVPLTATWTAVGAVARMPGVVGSWRSDVLWLERNFLAGLDALVRLTRSPRVLDVDDAIWLEGLGGWSVRSLARSVDVVVAGNAYLAGWFGRYCRDVRIVPTAIDCSRFRPEAWPGRSRKQFVVGWTGTSGNFKYLELVLPSIVRFLRRSRDASLMIVADRKPALSGLDGVDVEFVKWTPTREVDALHRMDVGIMPLSDDDWTRGKCSFKLLQYMAVGIPFIASPVGMNAEVLAHGPCGIAATTGDEWFDALTCLYNSADRGASFGRAGRQVALEQFDVPVIARRLAGIFNALVGRNSDAKRSRAASLAPGATTGVISAKGNG